MTPKTTNSATHLDRQRVAKNFGDAANSYDQHAALQRTLSKKIRGHWPALTTGATVLDVGCGTGLDSLWLKQQQLAVHAVDLSEGMLAAAQTRCGDSVTIHQCDVTKLSQLKLQAEGIWSCSMLQWAGDMPAAMREIHRSLTPQGQFWGCLFTQGSLAELESAWKAVDNDQHLSALPAESTVKQALLDAGFSLQWEESVSTALYFSNLNAIRDHLRGLGATNANQQRKKGLMSRSALKQLTSALEKHRQAQGIPLTWNAWLFGASKVSKAEQS